MNIDELFDLTSYRVHAEPHIRLIQERCAGCTVRACTYVCPARCYTWSEERGRVEFAYEACLECGTCLVLCDKDALEWHYPKGGFGVRFRGDVTAAVRILVLQQPAPDLRIAPERDLRTGAMRPEWDVMQLDPADSSALELALRLRNAAPASEVVLMHAGHAEVDPWLREGLARGADRAVRVWDGVVAEANAPGLAAVFAAAVGALSCDLVLAGAAGAAFGSGQLGVLVARALGWVCVTQVAGLADAGPTEAGAIVAPATAGPLRLSRALAAGWVGLVEVETPAVLTVVPSPASQQQEFDAPLPAALAALRAEIEVWDLARLGVSTAEVRAADHALRYGGLRAPRPRLQPVAAPDPALSAFERIQGLVRGAVRRREGRVVRAGELSIAQEVFVALRDEGWLDHLRADRPAAKSGSIMPVQTSPGAPAADAGDAAGPATAFVGDAPTDEY